MSLLTFSAQPWYLAQQNAGGPAVWRNERILPGNAVEYFVSYYDYYQPEAYVPIPTPSLRKMPR